MGRTCSGIRVFLGAGLLAASMPKVRGQTTGGDGVVPPYCTDKEPSYYTKDQYGWTEYPYTEVAKCGNGILEAGEECDVEGSCCVDCTFVQGTSRTVSASDPIICRLRNSVIDLSSLHSGTGLAVVEGMWRYDLYVEDGLEPKPMYWHFTQDGSDNLIFAWVDDTAEGEKEDKISAERIHVTKLSVNQDTQSVSFVSDKIIDGVDVRGLALHWDGWMSLLVRTGINETYPDDAGVIAERFKEKTIQNIEVRKYAADGTLLFSTELEDDESRNDTYIGRVNDFELGGGDMIVTDKGELIAYFKVSLGDTYDWHEGDAIWGVDSETGVRRSIQPWGCSHSMQQTLAFNRQLGEVLWSCNSDKFPRKGINAGHLTDASSWYNSKHVKEFDANGGGKVDGAQGEVIPFDDGFITIFSGTCCDPDMEYNGYSCWTALCGHQGTDVAIVKLDALGNVVNTVWLTDTDGVDEIAPHVARYGSNQLLVGWQEGGWKPREQMGVCSDERVKFWIATLDVDNFAFVDKPEEVTNLAMFGERNFWRTSPLGHVGYIYAYDEDKQKVVNYGDHGKINQVQVSMIITPFQASCGNGVIDEWAGETCDDSSPCCVECQTKLQCSAGACCDLETCTFFDESQNCPLDGDLDFDIAKCAEAPFGHSGPRLSEGGEWGNCGSCFAGVCATPKDSGGRIVGKSNTGWCPKSESSGTPCVHDVAYDWGDPLDELDKCMGKNNVHAPLGTVCGIEANGDQSVCTGPAGDGLLNYTTISCSDPAPPVPKYATQPDCPLCSADYVEGKSSSSFIPQPGSEEENLGSMPSALFCLAFTLCAHFAGLLFGVFGTHS